MPLRDQLPAVVVRRARLNGPAGEAWLETLDNLISALAEDWRLTLGAMLSGGSESAVIEVWTQARRPAVLKALVPGQDPGLRQARVLQAGGPGYAQVLAADPARGAYLVERLGVQLASLDWPIDRQIAVICGLLPQAWTQPPADLPLTDGAAKAADLAAYIEERWVALERPCARVTIDLALAYAESRGRAHRPESAVMAHGDAHAWNTLRRLDDPTRFKLIDPDPLFVEPAYDLAIPMREWGAALRADPVGGGRARCLALAGLTGLPPRPIWEWGFIERVSTGLAALSLELEGARQNYLAIADAWARDPMFCARSAAT